MFLAAALKEKKQNKMDKKKNKKDKKVKNKVKEDVESGHAAKPRLEREDSCEAAYDSAGWRPQDIRRLSNDFKSQLRATFGKDQHTIPEETEEDLNDSSASSRTKNLKMISSHSTLNLNGQGRHSENEEDLGPRRNSIPEIGLEILSELPHQISVEESKPPLSKESSLEEFDEVAHKAAPPRILVTPPPTHGVLSEERQRRRGSEPILSTRRVTKSQATNARQAPILSRQKALHEPLGSTIGQNEAKKTNSSPQSVNTEDSNNNNNNNISSNGSHSNSNFSSNGSRMSAPMPYRAIASYRGESEEDQILSLEEGDEAYLLGKTENGWWMMEAGNSRGWFPSNYLVPIPRPRRSPRRASSPDPRRTYFEFPDGSPGEAVEVLAVDENGYALIRAPERFFVLPPESAKLSHRT